MASWCSTSRAAPVCALLGLMAVSPVAAQGPSEPKLVCDRGPFASRTYGGTAWDIYGCSDSRSVAIVSAYGSPAMPFYFLFTESNGWYTLSGEGTGRQEFTRKAYDELSRLTKQQIEALVKETQKAKPGQ